MNKIYLFAVISFHLICRVNTCLAQTGFEPVINGMIDDAVNSSMSKEQVDKISDSLVKFSDVYGSAREIPGNIKGVVGTKTTKTQTEKKGLTFWQKIDRLILKIQKIIEENKDDITKAWKKHFES